MAPDVVVQMLFPRKTLGASRADVRFVGGVALHVPLEGRSIREYVEADRAGEHAAAEVTLAMPAEFCRAGERLTADLFRLILWSINISRGFKVCSNPRT